MKNKKINVPSRVQIGVGVILAIMILLSACSNPIGNSAEQGQVTLHLDVGSRTLVSDISTEISLYRVTFSDGSGSEVVVDSQNTTVQTSLPALKTYDILVEGFNSSSQLVATGVGSVSVDSGQSHSVAIIVTAADGSGTAYIEIQWNSVQTQSASVEGVLKDTQNQSIPMNFSVTSDGQAVGEVQVEDGFYTLEAQLLDGDTVVAGFAEAVQISADGTTQHVFSFDTVNKPGEAIAVTSDSFTVVWNPPEDPDTGDPLAVDGYRFYYREHGTYQWTHLADTGARVTEYTVTTAEIPYGEYDFAVSSVSSGEESELHTSYDDTAVPTYGWYIDWN
ncbi:MAG: fibronectin type III domain-containing protein [bacterium]